MKIGSPTRIRVEDFSSEEQKLAERIGGVVNDFNDQVYRALTNGIDFNNLAQQTVSLDLTTNATGQLVNPPSIKFNVAGYKYVGNNVISAISLTNSNVYPTSHPFLSLAPNNNILTILNCTGLPANSSFRLTVILIGG